MDARTGTVVFFDLAGYSKSPDPVQHAVANEFMKAVGDALADLWGEPCSPAMESTYFVQPTGDGVALILWSPAPKLESAELAGLWLAARILRWARDRKSPVGVRCGLHSGILDEVADPTGRSNWCGAAINEAARIMDGARAGQILASQSPFVQRLDDRVADRHPELRFEVSERTFELLAKHNLLLVVRSIRCLLYTSPSPRDRQKSRMPSSA